jgi:hypothetical protein
VIEEQTGRRRKVELTGGALPIQGASWGGLQLVSSTWNPGNREGTQQVLGPQEIPSVWDFEWRSNHLVRDPVVFTEVSRGVNTQIITPFDLIEVLESIFQGGALLRVTWITEGLLGRDMRITRLGRCTAWNFPFERVDDAAANITFDWISRGERAQKVSSSVGESLTSNVQAGIIACNAAAEAILGDVVRAANRQENLPTTFSLGQLESIADGPLQLVNSFARAAINISSRLRQIGDVVLKLKETPAAMYGRILDVANNGVAIANQFVDQLTREGPETQSTKMSVDILMRNASYFSEAQTKAEKMAEILDRVAFGARRRRSALVPSSNTSRNQETMSADDVLSVHVVRNDDTMASISQTYYGTPDLGDEIAIANGLPGYTIEPPRIPLIIPTRRSLEENTRNRD